MHNAMNPISTTLFCLSLSLSYLSGTAYAAASYRQYANIFFDPSDIVAGNYGGGTDAAQETIVAWADQLAAEGPWSVVNKTFTPTGADPHDYTSFAPYWWPDCSKVGNTTELTQEQIWAQCPYHQQDGQFNPDYLTAKVNNSGAINALADAVMYNSLAWTLTNTSKYAETATSFIKTWFLDPDTHMNPNLNYAQMNRGPDGQKGARTGILDMRGICKILSGILILRKTKSTAWTSDIDTQMRNWTTTYIGWLTTADLPLQEKAAPNNHGSFYFNQLAAFQILIDDFDGAKKTLQEYFNGIYQNQVEANGEQPEEAKRTLPYHYRAYNGVAMSINARLAKYVGLDMWTTPTKQGGTIQKAADYIIDTQTPPKDENSSPLDMYPFVAMVASTLGDAKSKYAGFLKNEDPEYPAQAWFFWEQPLSDSGIHLSTTGISNSTKSKSTGSADMTQKGNRASSLAERGLTGYLWLSGLIGLVGFGHELLF
ncbi:chondroitin AC/alginate lyase [Flagelloscypha sp. PMI_526]|nr:chondroitin AC/alginate lyase [Flagelloscypha sp. PMI_526]